VGVSILPDEKYTLCFTIANTLLEPQMSIRIQDDGTKFPADGSYLDCNITNNIGMASSLLTVRDYIITTPVATTFDVLDNDYFGTCGRDALTAFDTIADSGLKRGTLTINADSSFTYTPANPGFLGVDSLMYYIKCGADSSSAKVYILIQKPLSMKYVACNGASVTMGFGAATSVQYYWYNAATGGSIVANGNPANTLPITKGSAADIDTWWVEARSGNVVFPRYRVDLELSDNCGNTPTGCAVDGTVIFKEDFGGNSVTDPLYSSTPLPAGTTTYNFKNTCPSDGDYSLSKYYDGVCNTGWHIFEDHTVTGSDKGYFMFINADYDPGLFYTTTISNLCDNVELYFSVWIGNMVKSSYIGGGGLAGGIKPVLRFVIEDAVTHETLAIYTTGDVPATSTAMWKLYGFKFPNHSSSVKLSIYNDAPGGSGNDLALDDIEIRFCSPPVTMNISDTVVCSGTTLDIVSTYIEDCTFGDNLAYRLEFRHIDSVNWKPLDKKPKTVDCDSPTEAERKIEIPWTISSIRSADEGYYRMIVSSPTNIDKVNCRAVSDSVYVKVVGAGKVADIRVSICPLPDRPIRLSTFLDSLSNNTVTWSAVSQGAPAINSLTGEINSSNMKTTHKYMYSQTSKCGISSAIAYVHPLKTSNLRYIDTIVICKDEQRSRDIQINRISGLELNGGTWTYNSELSPYIKAFSTSSIYRDALVFDAYLAWENTGDGYKLSYHGDGNAKKFVFHYNATGSCVGNIDTDIVIIVTEVAF
jgi:hypothetical protein